MQLNKTCEDWLIQIVDTDVLQINNYIYQQTMSFVVVVVVFRDIIIATTETTKTIESE